MATAREENLQTIYGKEEDSGTDEGSEHDDWDEFKDENEFGVLSLCLFCDYSENQPEKIWQHCLQKHTVDIVLLKRKYDLDYFNYIKMVNYCRQLKCSLDSFLKLDKAVWQDDKFLKPVIEDDGLLQFDIDHIQSSDSLSSIKNDTDSNDSDGCKTDNDNGRPELEKALEKAMTELEMIKKAAQEMMLEAKSSELSGAGSVPSHSAIKRLKDDEDEAYFSSYGHFSIHQDMLKDSVRTNYYKDCIECNKHHFKDKVVLDIGCGTGILSMFAAKAGAKLVVGVEMSDIIYQAMDIIRENNLQDKIKLVKGRMEDVTLPVEKVDVIISEWMGYFLLFESMLDTILWARDHYLVKGGYVLPDFCSISLMGMEDFTQHKNNVTYWDDVYGFKMSCMQTLVLHEASVSVANKTNAFTESCTLKTIDIMNCSTKDLEFKSEFKLKAVKDMKITSFVSYFDVAWNNCDTSTTFSTSPFQETTHWKQTIFLLQSPVSLTCGEVLEGTLICSKNRKDPRSLNVTISFRDKIMKYLMQ